MTETIETVDVLIVGGGPVGMTLCLALAAPFSPLAPAGRGAGGEGALKVVVLDRRQQQARQADPRVLALSHGARQLLEQLSAWPARAATPIETIHISQKDGFGRSLLDRADYDLPALGYVVRYRDLAAGLAARLPAGSLLDSTEIVAKQEDGDGLLVTLRDANGERQIRTRLLVHAEGTPDDDPAIKFSDYHQQAVICEVTPLPPLQGEGRGGDRSVVRPVHQNRAWERFTPDGPLALLPLADEFSIVFTLPPAKADAVMAMDDDAFIAALQAQFGGRLRFAKPSRRNRFPLALRQRKTLVDGCQVWIGNCAQTLHPVSGQGFNLGLRDAWELAEILLENGVDRSHLARYAASRRLDREGGAFFTDKVVRLFSNDFGPLKLARGLGLLALDLCPPARHFVAKRMIWGARAWP